MAECRPSGWWACLRAPTLGPEDVRGPVPQPALDPSAQAVTKPLSNEAATPIAPFETRAQGQAINLQEPSPTRDQPLPAPAFPAPLPLPAHEAPTKQLSHAVSSNEVASGSSALPSWPTPPPSLTRAPRSSTPAATELPELLQHMLACAEQRRITRLLQACALGSFTQAEANGDGAYSPKPASDGDLRACCIDVFEQVPGLLRSFCSSKVSFACVDRPAEFTRQAAATQQVAETAQPSPKAVTTQPGFMYTDPDLCEPETVESPGGGQRARLLWADPHGTGGDGVGGVAAQTQPTLQQEGAPAPAPAAAAAAAAARQRASCARVPQQGTGQGENAAVCESWRALASAVAAAAAASPSSRSTGGASTVSTVTLPPVSTPPKVPVTFPTLSQEHSPSSTFTRHSSPAAAAGAVAAVSHDSPTHAPIWTAFRSVCRAPRAGAQAPVPASSAHGTTPATGTAVPAASSASALQACGVAHREICIDDVSSDSCWSEESLATAREEPHDSSAGHAQAALAKTAPTADVLSLLESDAEIDNGWLSDSDCGHAAGTVDASVSCPVRWQLGPEPAVDHSDVGGGDARIARAASWPAASAGCAATAATAAAAASAGVCFALPCASLDSPLSSPEALKRLCAVTVAMPLRQGNAAVRTRSEPGLSRAATQRDLDVVKPLNSEKSAPKDVGASVPVSERRDLDSAGPSAGRGARTSARPLSHVRRSLRVSSTDLQETVKKSLLTRKSQQAQQAQAGPGGGAHPAQGPQEPHTAPLVRAPTDLDMELRTLNIASLDRELLGLSLIGKGGGGLVFRAVWQGAAVAVKFMIGTSCAAVSMSALEAVLAASVNHPHVVQTYGFDVTRVRAESFEALQNDDAEKEDVGGAISSAAANILSELDKQKKRMQSHIRAAAAAQAASSSACTSPRGNSNTSLPSVTAGAGHTSEAGAGHTDQAGGGHTNEAPGHTLLETFNSDDGFGDPAEVPVGNVWTLNQVVKALNLQPGMFLTHIVMEICDRGTLLSALQRGVFRIGGTTGDSARFHQRVVLRAALRTARDIARGMQHLHASGIIHGDLKPGNVLLKGSRADRRGFVAKVGDFGLSKVVSDSRPLEMPHWSTVTHMAPEVIRGTWCKASDVYSFGVLLWQLCWGEPLPFRHMTVQQLVSEVAHGRLQLHWPAHCHTALVRLGQACLAYDPNKRPSFQEIGDVLVQIEQNVRNELRYQQQ